MSNQKALDTIVEFYPPDHGGRKIMPDLTTGMYRPHIVIQANLDQTYLGVSFSGGPDTFEPGEEIMVFARPLYENIDYSDLTCGVTFLIKEGHHTVGQGVVI